MKCSIRCVVLAGIGGMMPTVCRLASTCVASENMPLPQIGFYVGISIFFFIGATLAYAFSENNLKQAFILGICAPGIITNIVAGVADAQSASRKTPLDLLSVPSAYAQHIPIKGNQTGIGGPAPLVVVSDLKRITIRSHISGADKWDLKNLAIRVNSIGTNGKTHMTSYPATESDFTCILPYDIATMKIQVGNKETIVTLPSVHFSSAIINLVIKIEGRTDLQWALGGKRVPNIVGISASLDVGS